MNAPAPAPLIAPAELPIPRLMLLDDSEIDQMLCARIIRRTGLVGELVNFVDAQAALTYLGDPDAPPVDAILLDINMPCMNGFEFLETAMDSIGADFAQVVIVMLTTSLDPKDMARSDRCPLVKGYFNKPLLEQHLRQIAGMLARV